MIRLQGYDPTPRGGQLVKIPATRTLVVLLCCGVNRLLWRRIFLFRVFLFHLFLKKNKCCLDLCCGRWRISQALGPPYPRNVTITSNSHQWGRTNFGPAHKTELPGQKPLVINVVVVGPFEEEEEGTGVASDVVKVEGEDPATQVSWTGMTPGPWRFQYRYNKTKQHTHPRKQPKKKNCALCHRSTRWWDLEVMYQTLRSCTKRRNPEVQKLN